MGHLAFLKRCTKDWFYYYMSTYPGHRDISSPTTIQGLDLWSKINYYCDTCQIVSFYKESYSGIVLPRGIFAEQIATLMKGGIPRLVKQIHSHTHGLIRVYCQRHTLPVLEPHRNYVVYYILCVLLSCWFIFCVQMWCVPWQMRSELGYWRSGFAP